MIAIKFTFMANRYHATQWGRHVKEGVPEWPPSPWRILRGIVATWRRTLPDLASDRVVPILEAMAVEYPRFHLPLASAGHTRHYMPTWKKSTLVIDSFVAIRANKSVFAVWPSVELASQQHADLDRILRNMPYLGRAESWVEASLASEYPEINAYALESDALPKGDWEIIRTLTPRTSIKLKDLEVETSTLRRGRRIDPDQAQWWPYVRKRDCFTEFHTTPVQAPDGMNAMNAEVVRFALASKVLPMATDTLRWGDLARKCAMAQYGRQNQSVASERLSGKDASGNPLRNHRHAFYLPTDEDGDGRLDHLTVWTPSGLSTEEFRAVVSVNMLNPGGGREPVQLAYQAHGKPQDFVGVSPLFEKSKLWRSLTPYVLTRHIKFRGPKDQYGRKRIVDGPEDQVRREVALRWPNRHLIGVESEIDRRKRIMPMTEGRSSGFRPWDFFRYRQRGSNGGGTYNFKIEFEEEFSGPVILGFACHYGLGIFIPISRRL